TSSTNWRRTSAAKWISPPKPPTASRMNNTFAMSWMCFTGLAVKAKRRRRLREFSAPSKFHRGENRNTTQGKHRRLRNRLRREIVDVEWRADGPVVTDRVVKKNASEVLSVADTGRSEERAVIKSHRDIAVRLNIAAVRLRVVVKIQAHLVP